MPELNFTFEEMPIHLGNQPISGLLAYGCAVLTQDGDDFYVSAIHIDGGPWLPRDSKIASNTFEQILFRKIADVIENPRTSFGMAAAREWANLVAEEAPVVRMFKRRTGLLAVLTGGVR